MSTNVLQALSYLMDEASRFQVAQAIAAISMAVAGVLVIDVHELELSARFVLL